MNKEQEISLITKSLKGDQRAFKGLYDRHKRVLFLVCLRYSRNRADAEDYLQDAFITIFRKLDQFDTSRGVFEAWARRVTINTCLERLRKHSLYAVNISQAVHLPSQETDALSQMSLKELVSLIQTLPAGYQTIFNLYVIDGFTHKEIAEQLGISISTSKTQLMKARNMLQKKIDDRKLRIEDHG